MDTQATCATNEHMTADRARKLVATYYRIGVGRARIARTEAKLGLQILDAMRDDDLVVIFAETLRETSR